MSKFLNLHWIHFNMTTFVESSLEDNKMILLKKPKLKQYFIISIHETRTQRTLELKGTVEHSSPLHYIKNKETEIQGEVT